MNHRPVRSRAGSRRRAPCGSDQRFAAGEPYDELSQLAATLDVLLDRLAASLRREQRFSAEMSHELRTPLAKVRTEAELALRRERQPEEYRRALATVLRNTEQMSTAIEVLVSAAQQENVLARGRSRADAVLRDVAETCSALAAERGVELSVATLPTPLDLGVDLDIAVRILQPVVENACKFATSRASLSAERGQNGVLIRVDDDGPGVQPGEVETIFAPSVRGSAASPAAEGPATGRRRPEVGDPLGAGLSLSLSRRLARAAGVDVEAEAAASGGRFLVRLPAG
jgi:signal transduction histidine kinase